MHVLCFLGENHEDVVREDISVSFETSKSLPAGGTAIGGAVFNVFLLIRWKLGMKGKVNKRETKLVNRLHA